MTESKKFAAATNRNTLHKSLFDETATDPAQLLENVEECTPQQRARLRNQSCWTNADLCSPELIPDLKLQLLAKPQQAMHFERKQYEVVPDLLFRQFETAAQRFRAGRLPSDILHNFHRHSHAERKFFQWGPHETVQRIMGPVHYAIHVNDGHTQSMRPSVCSVAEQEDGEKLGTLCDLQNALVRSYLRPCRTVCTELVRHLELYLNATLQQAKLRGPRLAFIFEWSEAPEFDYVMCFTMPSSVCTEEPPRKKQKKQSFLTESPESVRERVVTLGRNDLLDGLSATVEEEEGGEKCAIAELRDRVRDAQLCYFFHAFVRRNQW